MNPHPNIAFDDSGKPVPAVGFEYPQDEPAPEVAIAAMTYQAEGLRLGLGFAVTFLEVRTLKAIQIRHAAMRHVLQNSGEPVKAIAKRLKCSRQHFYREVKRVRNATLLQ